MYPTLLLALIFSTPPAQSMGTVALTRGHAVLEVRGPGVSHWQPGLIVVVLARTTPDQPPLPLVDARVLGVSGTHATVKVLSEHPVGNLKGLMVAPRYLVEAELYGDTRTHGPNPVVKPELQERPKPKPKVFHKVPKPVRWGQPLWLEISTNHVFNRVQAHVRQGAFGSYTVHKLKKQATAGHWGGAIMLKKPDRQRKVVQYFISATDKDGSSYVAGSPSHPHAVQVQSAPARPQRAIMQHHPVGRVKLAKALELTAKVDQRFTKPQLHFRQAGGGQFLVLSMEAIAPGVFSIQIPGDKVRLPHLRYYLSAEDSDGLRLPGFASAMKPHKVRVTRGKVLSDNTRRNRISVSGKSVQNEAERDHYTEVLVRYERVFFPFMLARIGFSSVQGQALRRNTDGNLEPADLQLTGGEGGLELRIKDYLSLVGDLQAVAYADGSALGHRVGIRVGDDRGAGIGFSYGAVRDVDDWSFIGETGEAYLSTPLSARLRLTGRIETDDLYQDAQRSLRLLVEVAGRVGKRLEFNVEGGSSTRDGVTNGGVGRFRIGWSF